MCERLTDTKANIFILFFTKQFLERHSFGVGGVQGGSTLGVLCH
jgi:hypothetical protein